ncbi:MAG: ribosomal 5S rRNA E-loop-binding protein Ctc/L25/TL5 [Desulfobulbaceae bacterium A2]|nr:MAG: ribosomal 5S rRNA E-loop-binding protein Ctc/L25/TL5 [Desulfobulbaceae bacterium A2]
MLQFTVGAAVRSITGKGPMRRLRMAGKTPGNVYGRGHQAMSLEFDTKTLWKELFTLHQRNAVITLNIEGEQQGVRHTLLQEIQKDPVTGKLIHVDFLDISLDDPKSFEVPIEFTGTAVGVAMGGELHVHRSSVHLQGKPLEIPDVVTVDLTPLKKGEAGYLLGDLSLPAGVTMLDKPTLPCVAVL